MRLPRWLCRLAGRRPPESTGDDSHPATADVPQVPSPAYFARADRMRATLDDPDFAARRKAAVRTIRSRIDAVVMPRGYARKGANWTRPGPRCTQIVNLQRSRHGFDAYINLAARSPAGRKPAGPAFTMDDHIRIGRFLPDDPQVPEPGRIGYMLVFEDPAILDAIVDVLETRALPWLDTCHTTLRMTLPPKP